MVAALVVTSSIFRGLDVTSYEETRYAYNMLTGKTVWKKKKTFMGQRVDVDITVDLCEVS